MFLYSENSIKVKNMNTWGLKQEKKVKQKLMRNDKAWYQQT